MPHKRNPWRFENLTGLARVVRGYASSALENLALWHERDISNSSVERIVLPDAMIAVDFMLHRLAGLVESLVVHADRMRETLDGAGGLIFSGTLLLKLAERGIAREEAYRLVQGHAMQTWEQGGQLLERVIADPEIGRLLDKSEIEAAFDLERTLRNVDAIFERALRETGDTR